MEVKINKEIRDYSESLFLGLSLRQCVYSLLAVLTAVGLYFTLQNVVGQMEIGWICILGATPFAALGFLKYQGMTAGQFVLAIIRTELFMPERLLFESENTYVDILLPALEEERRRRLKVNNKKKQEGADEII